MPLNRTNSIRTSSLSRDNSQLDPKWHHKTPCSKYPKNSSSLNSWMPWWARREWRSWNRRRSRLLINSKKMLLVQSRRRWRMETAPSNMARKRVYTDKLSRFHIELKSCATINSRSIRWCPKPTPWLVIRQFEIRVALAADQKEVPGTCQRSRQSNLTSTNEPNGEVKCPLSLILMFEKFRNY